MTRISMALAAFLAFAPVAAPAQTMDHSAHGGGMMSPSTDEYAAVMDTMMSQMMVPMSGDPDIDFVRGMIPHHQGAVDNARIVLKYGKDPEVRKFAESVIAAQEAEIKWMLDWLAKKDK